MEPTTTPVTMPSAEVLQTPLNTGAIVLRPGQVPDVKKELARFDFESMAASDVLRIGLDAEHALQRTLDGFLARLDKNTAAKVFALFGQLEKGIEDANLAEVLDKIQNPAKPGFLGSLLNRFRGRRAEEIAEDLMVSIGDLVSGRTKTLADEMTRLENELGGEMGKLFSELQVLDELKRAYSKHFGEFTVAAATARALQDKARVYVAEEKANLNAADPVAQSRFMELSDKLRLLESRALALEGTYTRLPADQLVIQQIEQAGVATLQETATTVSSRFASIKMTLLSIHGAFAVKNVQQIAERQARLDAQLTDLRSRALRDVAVKAAEAPGNNRLAQTKQIEQIIATTKEIHGLVAAATAATDEKFEEARRRFVAARQELASLSA
ncbi:hypothetical protein [Pleomorphomonas sp. PLEO]|uniref:hypothetical protein n=1 Tax=Pleomorphomonas sp. PLEO TaxID=3239306 RepID=UPI00351E5B12